MMTAVAIEKRMFRAAIVLLRLALGIGFISAVADRFGLWGPPGASSVAWGNMSSFLTYTGKLAPWCPPALLPTLAWSVTAAEIVLGMLLLTGVKGKLVALCTSLLAMTFAISMTVVLGPHSPLNYSVFVFAFAALLLGLSKKENHHE
jgi:uncharacterized membrane protein YphA (DoxX/SURF4 family)